MNALTQKTSPFLHQIFKKTSPPAKAASALIGVAAKAAFLYKKQQVLTILPMAISKEQKKAGFTRVELAVVIVIGVLFVLWAGPALIRSRIAVMKASCRNNLKQIAIAYFVFGTDHNELPPARVSITNGGWSEYLTNGNAGPNCWMNYAAMHIELGEAPKVVLCPQDNRKPAAGFPPIGSFTNLNVSYFVGVGADTSHPRSIIGGDRNLCFGPKPGKKYGFSPANGAGNDVLIQTNSAKEPLFWSKKIHYQNQAQNGYLAFGDGNVQQCDNTNLQEYQAAALDSGNFASNAIPKTPSFRLVFP